jgi:hypothetical protein
MTSFSGGKKGGVVIDRKCDRKCDVIFGDVISGDVIAYVRAYVLRGYKGTDVVFIFYRCENELFTWKALPRMGVSFCLEYPVIGKLDCSGESLSKIPYSRAMPWVRDADFSRNNLTVVNTTELLMLFPKIVRIDLRDNPLKCSFTTIAEILSDCPTTMTTIPLPTTRLSVSTGHPRSTSTTLPAVNISTAVNTSTVVTSGNGKPDLYLFIVIPVCIIACIVFACFLFVYVVKRRRRPSNSIRMEHLFSIVPSDSDSDLESNL